MIRFVDNTYLHDIDACLTGSGHSLNQLGTFLRFIGEVVVSEEILFTVNKKGPVYSTTERIIHEIKQIANGTDLFTYFSLDSKTYADACDNAEKILAEEMDYLSPVTGEQVKDMNPVFTGRTPHEAIHKLIVGNRLPHNITSTPDFSEPISSNIAPFVILRDSIYSKIAKLKQNNAWSFDLTQYISVAARMLAYEHVAETIGSTYLTASGRLANDLIGFPLKETSFLNLTDKVDKKLYRPQKFFELSDIVDSLIIISNGNPRIILQNAFLLRDNTNELRRRFSEEVCEVNGDAYLIAATRTLREYQDIVEDLLEGKPTPEFGLSVRPTIIFPGIPLLGIDIDRLKLWIKFKTKSRHVKNIASLMLKAKEKRKSGIYKRLITRCIRRESIDTIASQLAALQGAAPMLLCEATTSELTVPFAPATSNAQKEKVKMIGSSQQVVLFLAADPTDASRLRLGEEFREIKEQLALARQRDFFKLAIPQLSLRSKDISLALLEEEPRIVHFSGHGTSKGALCFENEAGRSLLVTPESLAALFQQFAGHVQCVLLSACYSETQARAIAKHVNYVIGMKAAIGDKAAVAFSLGFYQALGAGRQIKDAYTLGCVQIGLQGSPQNLTPILMQKDMENAAESTLGSC